MPSRLVNVGATSTGGVPVDLWISIGKFLHLRYDLIPLLTSVNKDFQRSIVGTPEEDSEAESSFFNSIFQEQAREDQKQLISNLVAQEQAADFEGYKMNYNRSVNAGSDKPRKDDDRPPPEKCLILVKAGAADDVHRVNWRQVCIFTLGYEPQRTRGPRYLDINNDPYRSSRNGQGGWLKYCVLQSKEGDEFKVKKDVAVQRSKLLASMIEVSDSEAECVISLPTISTSTLVNVLLWCEQHYNNEMQPTIKPIPKDWETDKITEWDYHFHRLNLLRGEMKDLGGFGGYKGQECLTDIITAANYLDMKDLLDFGCALVAASIRGKSPEEIRTLWGIQNDFSPEEEEKIREENRWCEE